MLLQHMIPSYIRVVEQYIKENKASYLYKHVVSIFLPGEKQLAIDKLELANAFLKKLNLMLDCNFENSLEVNSPVFYANSALDNSEQLIQELENELKSERSKSYELRLARGNHKPGSYDGILEVMKRNLDYIKKKTKRMNRSALDNISVASTPNQFTAPYRKQLEIFVEKYFCELSFDHLLLDSKSVPAAKKSSYGLKSGVMTTPKDILTRVKLELKKIIKDRLLDEFKNSDLLLRTIIDYSRVLDQLKLITDIDSKYIALLKNDLENLEIELLNRSASDLPIEVQILRFKADASKSTPFFLDSSSSETVSAVATEEFYDEDQTNGDNTPQSTRALLKILR